jgi:hypothetical protein
MIPSSIPPALLLDDSADRFARELRWTSQEFSPAGIIITVILDALISPGDE